jgi:hypothetical protein
MRKRKTVWPAVGVLSPADNAALRLPSDRVSQALPMDDDSLSTCDDSSFRASCPDNTDVEAMAPLSTWTALRLLPTSGLI